MTNEGERRLIFYFYVDYETYDARRSDRTSRRYFHAQWRRENPTDGWGDDAAAARRREERARGHGAAPTSTGEGNYVILEADGPRPLRRLQPEHRLSSRSSRTTGTAKATT